MNNNDNIRSNSNEIRILDIAVMTVITLSTASNYTNSNKSRGFRYFACIVTFIVTTIDIQYVYYSI